MAPSPYFFVKSFYLVYMNIFARFDEIPAMILQDIKEIKNVTDEHTDGQHENSIPSTKKSLSEITECQTVGIQIRPYILSGLIRGQTACKGYQQTTLVNSER